MSLPKNVVSVDLGNLPRPVALDLLDASAGASVVAYADPNGHTRRTLPYSASDDSVVKFYVDADEVWLSAKVNTHEVADAGGTTKYVVADPHRSDAEPAVQLEWNADRLNQAAPSGGSTPATRAVVEFLDSSYTGAATGYSPVLTISTPQDWVALKVGDATTLIVQPGLYVARYFINVGLQTGGLTLHASLHPGSSDAGPEVGVTNGVDGAQWAFQVTETYAFDAATQMWPVLSGDPVQSPAGDIHLIKFA